MIMPKMDGPIPAIGIRYICIHPHLDLKAIKKGDEYVVMKVEDENCYILSTNETKAGFTDREILELPVVNLRTFFKYFERNEA